MARESAETISPLNFRARFTASSLLPVAVGPTIAISFFEGYDNGDIRKEDRKMRFSCKELDRILGKSTNVLSIREVLAYFGGDPEDVCANLIALARKGAIALVVHKGPGLYQGFVVRAGAERFFQPYEDCTIMVLGGPSRPFLDYRTSAEGALPS